MTDLLLRDIDEDIKRRLEERAREHRRSLSDEAKAIIRGALVEPRDKGELGTEIISIFARPHGVDLDIPPRELPEDPPDFG